MVEWKGTLENGVVITSVRLYMYPSVKNEHTLCAFGSVISCLDEATPPYRGDIHTCPREKKKPAVIESRSDPL